MGTVLRRVSGNVRLLWGWFKHWRKRYVWLRLVILLLIFASPVYGIFRPTIRELVVIAIKGIEAAKFGPRLYARAYEFQEKKRLQSALRAEFDANGDGLLNRAEAQKLTAATGLSKSKVTGSGLDVELDALVEASHKTGLLSRVVGATDIRRRVLDRALDEWEAEHQALWREVEPMLRVARPRGADYLRWQTWAHGFETFRLVIGSPADLGLSSYFVGVSPSDELEQWYHGYHEPAPRWKGYLGWLFLLALVVVSVRRYGKGQELRRRFGEEPELAAAPCPLCGQPTHDYGALIQHRAARAWAMGAVVGLVTLTLAALGSATGGHVTEFGMLGAGAVVGTAAGGLRWWLWPREVHACHRRRYLPVVGFAMSVLVVVTLALGVATSGMRVFDWPHRGVLISGSFGRPTRPGRLRPTVRREPVAPPAVGARGRGRATRPPVTQRTTRRRARAGRSERVAGTQRRGPRTRRARRAR
ncbi:MAG: hypothetical protein JSV79_13745 [Armatimonadota bacterium]|nr:MAG: hypothetical protein JSV79_13745 [Armatimonadota bacterium]